MLSNFFTHLNSRSLRFSAFLVPLNSNHTTAANTWDEYSKNLDYTRNARCSNSSGRRGHGKRVKERRRALRWLVRNRICESFESRILIANRIPSVSFLCLRGLMQLDEQKVANDLVALFDFVQPMLWVYLYLPCYYSLPSFSFTVTITSSVKRSCCVCIYSQFEIYICILAI